MNKSQEIHPELQPDFKPEMPESHHLPAWVWIVTIAVIGLFVIGLVAYGAYQYLNSNDQDGCITLYEPVCGKDGKTYSNSCVADLDGAEVDYMGRCEVDETEDWQTYRNEEYRFEVKYPEDWDVYYTSGNEPPYFVPLKAQSYFHPIEESGNPFISIEAFDISWEAMLSALNAEHTLHKKLVVDGYEAIEKEALIQERINIRVAVNGPNNIVYELRLYKKEQPYLDIFSQMLSTFKFID